VEQAPWDRRHHRHHRHHHRFDDQPQGRNMKKIRFVVLTFLCLISEMIVAEEKPPEPLKSFFGSGLFESNFGDDNQFGLTLGYKGWMNTWSLPVPFADSKPYEQDASVLFKSETELTSMPTLHLRYKNLYLVANHFSETKYTFGRQRISSLYRAPIGMTLDNGQLPDSSPLSIKQIVDYIPSAERSEWDVSLGYYVNPYLGVTVGYKQINRNYDYQVNYPAVETIDSSGKTNQIIGSRTEHLYSESQGSGTTLGITGNVPVALNKNLSIYGHFTYGWLNTEVKNTREVGGKSYDEGSISYDNPYYSGEVGFAYLLRFKDVTLSTYLGYRFQRYEFRNFTNSGQTARDGTDGIMLSFSATF